MTSTIYRWCFRAFNSEPPTMQRDQIDTLHDAGKLTEDEYVSVISGVAL